MIGIYLSGTGNTKHCIEKLMELLDQSAQAIPIEGKETANLLEQHDFVVLAYPIQFSNVPVIVRDFIKDHSDLWKGKTVLCLATKVVGGLHVHMPDSVCDVKLLKKSVEKNREIIKAADRKIENCVGKMKQGKYPKDGLYFYDRIAGLLCQRLWYYGKTKDYSDKLKINKACTGCGLCVSLCPMENLVIKNSKATAGSRCTMCYRCISSCPHQAITLLGDTVVEQCRYERDFDK